MRITKSFIDEEHVKKQVTFYQAKSQPMTSRATRSNAVMSFCIPVPIVASIIPMLTFSSEKPDCHRLDIFPLIGAFRLRPGKTKILLAAVGSQVNGSLDKAVCRKSKQIEGSGCIKIFTCDAGLTASSGLIETVYLTSKA